MRPHRQNKRFVATESLLAPAPRRHGPSVTFSTSRQESERKLLLILLAATHAAKTDAGLADPVPSRGSGLHAQACSARGVDHSGTSTSSGGASGARLVHG